MLATHLEEVGSYYCRLSDRDNAELSIGHGDTGKKGETEPGKYTSYQSPFISCLPGSLQILMWQYIAAEPSCFVTLFIPICEVNANSLVACMSHYYLCKQSGLWLCYLVACFYCFGRFFFSGGHGFGGLKSKLYR